MSSEISHLPLATYGWFVGVYDISTLCELFTAKTRLHTHTYTHTHSKRERERERGGLSK